MLAGVITQNVDGLHGAAGSRAVVELHGALAPRALPRVRLSIVARRAQARLIAANPEHAIVAARFAPDGDIDVPAELIADFAGSACDGVRRRADARRRLFGGSVPRATLDQAWALFERAELLLVVGSSLAVFSGYRFVRRAASTRSQQSRSCRVTHRMRAPARC